jgi:hypothetical protein
MRASNPEKEINIKSSVGYQSVGEVRELIGFKGNAYPSGNTTYLSAIPSRAMIDWMLQMRY